MMSRSLLKRCMLIHCKIHRYNQCWNHDPCVSWTWVAVVAVVHISPIVQSDHLYTPIYPHAFFCIPGLWWQLWQPLDKCSWNMCPCRPWCSEHSRNWPWHWWACQVEAPLATPHCNEALGVQGANQRNLTQSIEISASCRISYNIVLEWNVIQFHAQQNQKCIEFEVIWEHHRRYHKSDPKAKDTSKHWSWGRYHIILQIREPDMNRLASVSFGTILHRYR